MGDGDWLHECYPAVADSVSRAREAVSAFAESAGATAQQLDAINLAVSEAATNVVVHAYEGDPGNLYIEGRLDSGALWIRVADDGLGLRPDIDRRRPNIDSRRPNIDSRRPNIDGPGLGVGLALISQVADAVAISTRPSRGTEVLMRFKLGVGRVPRPGRRARSPEPPRLPDRAWVRFPASCQSRS